MIENKRFIPVYKCVTQDNEVYVVCKGEHNADVVATALNEFYERNEYLEKESEQLKQEKNEIKKWVNDKISYLEKKYEFGQTEYKGCPMHNIQFGINILKELQEYWEEQEND